MNNTKTTPRIIIALDDGDMHQIQQLLQHLPPERCNIKIGKALFTRFGPAFVEKLVATGYKVFLDLKYHDIPQQVFNACRAAADLNVWMLTIHASGGSRMIAAAREALAKSSHSPLLVAVTVLTSLNDQDLEQLGVSSTVEQQVLRLGKLALNHGADGLVCSPNEVMLIREQLSQQCCLVTPGIRPADSARDDQQRTLTPQQAIAAGSDYLVIGRPITQAADPLSALNQIELDMAAHSV